MPESTNTWQRWNTELELARKAKHYKGWLARGKKIVRRYRDQRTDEAEYTDTAHSAESARFNILWSNVQTLMPAVFAKRPKPVVERRYLDRDDTGRTASVILERALLYELDTGTFFEATRRAVLDRLLPGRGIVWVRYEPTFRTVPAKTQETEAETEASDGRNGGADRAGVAADINMGGAGTGAGVGQPAAGDTAAPVGAAPPEQPTEPEQEKIYECVPVDYLDWTDFLCSPARTWEEVWWVAKRVYMTRDELKDRFGDKIGGAVKLDWTPAEAKEGAPGVGTPGVDDASKAKIWEIWNKRARKVVWISESDNNGSALDEKPDPLKLDGFWPCPKPLSATLTNDSMVPVPDYAEYQDQATELDDLTGRIQELTHAIKIAGVYDASIPALQRIFQEGKENGLVGVDNMAEFMQKAGADGMGHMWLAPIKDYAYALMELYKARDQVKQIIYELTGISDIVRGQAAEGGAKTATEQRIKGQFASLRLNDLQSDVARFARDVLSIMGEIISEHYSDETLYLVSAYEQYAREQFLPSDGASPPATPAGMDHNGGPPMNPMQTGPGGQGGGAVPQGGPMPPPNGPAVGPMGAVGAPPAMGGLGGLPGLMPPPPPTPAQMAADLFRKAVALLRNDKLRGFRIDVETDSMIEPDQQAMQQGRVEFLTAVGKFMEKAVPMGQMNPKFMPLLGKMLLFMARSFKAGRELEGALEQAVDDMEKQAKNPPPKQPTPEEIKAQAEIQKQQMESQRQQQQAAIDQQMAQAAMAMQQQKAQIEIEKERAKLEIEKERMAMEREKMAMELQGMQAKQQVDAQGMALKSEAQQQTAAIDAQAADHAAELDRQATDHKHEVGLEMLDAKAKNAAQPAAKGGGA